MTPAPIPETRVRTLAELEQLDTGSRLRYRALGRLPRDGTVLEVRPISIGIVVDRPALELLVLFDDRAEPERVIAAEENVRRLAFSTLPDPVIYEPQEAQP